MDNSFNIADIIVIIILALSTYICYKRGIIQTIYGFVSTIVSLILSRILYTPVALMLKQTSLFNSIKQYSIEFLDIDSIIQASSQKQTEFINQLNLPEFLKDGIISGNNSTGFKILDASNIQDYIGNYIAEFIINISAMIITFIITYVVLKFICSTFKILSKLPIIKTLNNIVGAIIGFFQGVLIIWIIFAIVSIFFTKPVFSEINNSIASSVIAKQFYDSNIIIKGLSNIE